MYRREERRRSENSSSSTSNVPARGNGRDGRGDEAGEELAEEAEAAERGEKAVIPHRTPWSGTGLPWKWVLRHCHLQIQKSLHPLLRVPLEFRTFVHQTRLQATGSAVRVWKPLSQARFPCSTFARFNYEHLLQLQAGSHWDCACPPTLALTLSHFTAIGCWCPSSQGGPGP